MSGQIVDQNYSVLFLYSFFLAVFFVRSGPVLKSSTIHPGINIDDCHSRRTAYIKAKLDGKKAIFTSGQPSR